jgi:hypothetical protein
MKRSKGGVWVRCAQVAEGAKKAFKFVKMIREGGEAGETKP